MTPWGSGRSECDGLALTRWSEDPCLGGEGFFLYLKDEAGRICIPSHPSAEAIQRGEGWRFEEDLAQVRRLDQDLEIRWSVATPPGLPGELRQLCLVNHGPAPRRLEMTSCLEPVLHLPEADAAHPAFSKLFLETDWLAPERLLVVKRRPRAADEAPRALFHWVQGVGMDLSWETDRARFLGRGRQLMAPKALDTAGPLTGTLGPVLDPVLAFRALLDVPPGGRRTLTFGLVLTAAPQEALRWREICTELTFPWRQEEAPLPTSAPLPKAHYHLLLPETDHRREESPANGLGQFAPDGREYVIRIRPDAEGFSALPPMPWCNVIANERFGFLATERGLSCTWNGNSRLHRLTPWINDPIADPLPEALYLRDPEEGLFWSPMPGPAGRGLSFTLRHGFGYSQWSSSAMGLEQDVTAYAALHEPVRFLRLRLHNPGPRKRRLELFWYVHLVLGESPSGTRNRIHTAREGHALYGWNTNQDGPFAQRVAFASVGGPGLDLSTTTERASFLGRPGTLEAPEAVTRGAHLDGREGGGLDPCFAFQTTLELAPGEHRELLLLFGEAEHHEAARTLVARFGAPTAGASALEAVREFWNHTLQGLQIETPDPALNHMVNGWLPYQNLVCRLWGRTAYYQSGGAFGFRDQLQDAAALLYLDPALTRRQILLHAAHQFVEGDVLHWWHPPLEQGIRTKFSDDLLWLPYVTAFYLESTGETGLLQERLPYLEARPLAEEEDEAYLQPTISDQTGDLYDHCCRALDRSTSRMGSHGLPLMGTGDWNDGMNRVGRLGRGESVWMAFFLHAVLESFIPCCELRGDAARVQRYRACQQDLRKAAETAGWDGAWYRRAYYDDGTPLGSAENTECRIDCIAQAWSTFSGAAPEARMREAMHSLETHLLDSQHRLLRLLTPAFDRCDHDPGYIKGYLPGVRENGGQYTHGALWAAKAWAHLGEMDRAAALLSMLSPMTHGRTKEEVGTYQVEPYVIAADVYGEAPHAGRGGWTWYTGSAGWMYRVVTEDLLGLRLKQGKGLSLTPRLPRAWNSATLHYRDKATRDHYRIRLQRDPSLETGGLRAFLNGTVLPLGRDGLFVAHSRSTVLQEILVLLGPSSQETEP
ncbi:MAG: glycosyl transferase [Firmicutes bacterium]|nr:glycosyl transferase [Bacillota bacterium]